MFDIDTKYMAAALLALAFTLIGCTTPSIVVRHEDPRVASAQVFVDGAQVGVVQRGEELRIDVARGLHNVEVKAPGETRSPWTADGGAVELVVDVRAVLTLMRSSSRDEPEK